MKRTRLGISVGLLGAAIYFMGLFGGYLLTTLLAGYVLLFEDNEWLRKSAVKAVVLLVFCSFLSTVTYLLPDFIGLLSSILRIFNGSFQIMFITNLASAIVSVVNFAEKLLFLALGLKALNQGNVSIPVVDKLIEKYM